MEIIKDFIPIGRKNRPRLLMLPKWITIHDTANAAAYADAEAHAAYLQTLTAANKPVSWHFTVDGGCIKEGKMIKPPQIYQHLPLNESAYHAGDGNGNGNRASIGIEICENTDGNRYEAERLAARLVAYLMTETGIGITAIVQHHYWTGKNCPRVLRSRPAGWEEFLKMVKSFSGPFKDVPFDHWAAEAIALLKEKGIMVGYGDGTFHPENMVTRAELAVVARQILIGKG